MIAPMRRLATLAALRVQAFTLLPACWPEPSADWEDDRGEAITRVRATEGDSFVKLKEGLARTIYGGLAGDERCSEGDHCRRRGEHLICSSENRFDPFVCELHLVDENWVAPREDWELFHSMEPNWQSGIATLDGDRLTIDGAAGDELGDQLGSPAPVTLTLLVPEGRIEP
jgi:hypothetical protein